MFQRLVHPDLQVWGDRYWRTPWEMHRGVKSFSCGAGNHRQKGELPKEANVKLWWLQMWLIEAAAVSGSGG